MNPDVLWRYLPSLISGFGVTIFCWSAGGALGMILGFAIALARRARFPPLQWALGAFIEVFRGTPFLMQLFLLYSGGPYIGLKAQRDGGRRSRPRPLFLGVFRRDIPRRIRLGSARPDRGRDQRRHGPV